MNFSQVEFNSKICICFLSNFWKHSFHNQVNLYWNEKCFVHEILKWNVFSFLKISISSEFRIKFMIIKLGEIHQNIVKVLTSKSWSDGQTDTRSLILQSFFIIFDHAIFASYWNWLSCQTRDSHRVSISVPENFGNMAAKLEMWSRRYITVADFSEIPKLSVSVKKLIISLNTRLNVYV